MLFYCHLCSRSHNISEPCEKPEPVLNILASINQPPKIEMTCIACNGTGMIWDPGEIGPGPFGPAPVRFPSSRSCGACGGKGKV